MTDSVKYLLEESKAPKFWYNINADLPSPPPPPLHPGTKQPAGPDDFAPLFPMALIMQEVSGEREIETDRRIIRNKISLLKKKLATIDRQMTTQRSNRKGIPRVALVGYTNVGKSTLMNVLSKSDVFSENKLFATLDTTVRKVVINNFPFLLSDTVGFIRKLPTQLVESFKSTLDEIRESDLLIHVVDISHPNFEEQMDSVDKILEEINCIEKPMIVVFNKIICFTIHCNTLWCTRYLLFTSLGSFGLYVK